MGVVMSAEATLEATLEATPVCRACGRPGCPVLSATKCVCGWCQPCYAAERAEAECARARADAAAAEVARLGRAITRARAAARNYLGCPAPGRRVDAEAQGWADGARDAATGIVAALDDPG